MYMCECVRTCVRVCAYVYVINENKHPFQGFCYLISHALLIYPSNHRHFRHVGLSFSVFYVQVTWQNLEHPITRLNCDRRSSLK